jgi:chromosome segregation ATPase
VRSSRDQIDSLKADLADTNVMLGSLTNKYDTLEAQRKSIQDAIDRANSVLTDSLGFTREKVFRLKGRFSSTPPSLCSSPARDIWRYRLPTP